MLSALGQQLSLLIFYKRGGVVDLLDLNVIVTLFSTSKRDANHVIWQRIIRRWVAIIKQEWAPVNNMSGLSATNQINILIFRKIFLFFSTKDSKFCRFLPISRIRMRRTKTQFSQNYPTIIFCQPVKRYFNLGFVTK